MVRVGVSKLQIRVDPDVHVKLVKSAANDLDVVKAARVSTIGSEAESDGDDKPEGLINYLMRDRHGSPFEHNSMTFMISAPIFVFREFHRHRVGWSYNEESARYREMEPVFYIPDDDRNLVQVGKPGAYEYVAGNGEQQWAVQYNLTSAYRTAWRAYQNMLSVGVAREVARMALPVGMFSTMYATCNARSLMHFLSLRTKHERALIPSFPQREIEMVAEKMEHEWEQLMPITHAMFNKHGRVAP